MHLHPAGVFRRQQTGTTKQTHLATEVNTMGRRLVSQKNSSDTSLPYECQQIPELAGLKDYLKNCTGKPGLRGKPYYYCLEYWHSDAFNCPDAVDDVYSTCSYYYHCSDMSSYLSVDDGGVNPFGAGAIAYILGVLYTFAGLAVVCDEYFVPALEVLVKNGNSTTELKGNCPPM